MKKIISIFLIFSFSFFSLYAEEENCEKIQAKAAEAGIYHAAAISMVFWGVLLVAGFAVATILIKSSSSSS